MVMYIGKSIKRFEDVRFLTGRGNYVDDMAVPGAAYAVFIRSTHAHANIRTISSAAAEAMPGVLAVLTGDDWEAEGLGKSPIVWHVPLGDQAQNEAPRPTLTAGRVRHVGDTIAVIIAETHFQALDAAEAVEVDYEPLPANVVTGRALDAETPVIHENLGSNAVFDVEIGDQAATDEAFAGAAHIERLAIKQNRITAVPMEARCMVGEYDAANDRYTLWTGTQNPHFLREWLATSSLKVPEHKIRVVAPDMGGGFGQKIYHYPEDAVVLWASRKIGRPVRWTSTRAENLMVDTHARDHDTTAEMAFDEDGHILGLRVQTLAACGAYLSPFGSCIPSFAYGLILSGAYAIPAIFARIRGAYTNTTPVDAYRGAGRPEGICVAERMLANYALETGQDERELRRKNFIQPEQYPYTSATGAVYDSGDIPELDRKLDTIFDYDAARAEQARLREEGVLMGIGIAALQDSAGFGPSGLMAQYGARDGFWDSATVRVYPSGKVTALCGSHSHGQGHTTTFAQVLADELGIPIEDIDIAYGDTDQIPVGRGTYASRSMTLVGSALKIGGERVIKKGRILTAHLLEVEPEEIEYEEGRFQVKGANRSMTFAEMAKAAYTGASYPEGFEIGLEISTFFDPPEMNYPSAIHAAIVLVDPHTGRVTLREYYAVDDAGLVINPMVVEGQIHGGLAQGIGQAMMEQCVFDPESGQLLTGSLMDYCVPRADDVPSYTTMLQEIPSTTNPLGVKGIGETGTIGAPPAIGNAVIDALWHLGVRHIDMPFTSEKVWRAIRETS
jgi:carbon-monoxide dehydrogenase large subunit